MSSRTAAENARQLRREYDQSIGTSCQKLYSDFFEKFDPTKEMYEQAISNSGTSTVKILPYRTTNNNGHYVDCVQWARNNKDWVKGVAKNELGRYGIKDKDIKITYNCARFEYPYTTVSFNW